MAFKLAIASVFLCSFILKGNCAAVKNEQLTGLENAITEEKLHFDVNVNGESSQENIELNYAENYVKVTTPGFDQAATATLIHDYTKGLTVYKLKGRCFLMSEFQDIPPNMEDWRHLSFNMEGGIVQAGGQEAYRVHNYKIIPFTINKTTLPAVIQGACDDVTPVAFRRTVAGEEAYHAVHDGVIDKDAFLGVMFVPNTCGERGATQKQLEALKNLPRKTKGPKRRDCNWWCFICFASIED